MLKHCNFVPRKLKNYFLWGNEIRKNYFEYNNNVDKLVEMLRVNHMLNFF
jgi:hypothetical protein